jgi:hypothetical protein
VLRRTTSLSRTWRRSATFGFAALAAFIGGCSPAAREQTKSVVGAAKAESRRIEARAFVPKSHSMALVVDIHKLRGSALLKPAFALARSATGSMLEAGAKICGFPLHNTLEDLTLVIRGTRFSLASHWNVSQEEAAECMQKLLPEWQKLGGSPGVSSSGGAVLVGDESIRTDMDRARGEASPSTDFPGARIAFASIRTSELTGQLTVDSEASDLRFLLRARVGKEAESIAVKLEEQVRTAELGVKSPLARQVLSGIRVQPQGDELELESVIGGPQLTQQVDLLFELSKSAIDNYRSQRPSSP